MPLPLRSLQHDLDEIKKDDESNITKHRNSKTGVSNPELAIIGATRDVVADKIQHMIFADTVKVSVCVCVIERERERERTSFFSFVDF